MKNNNLLRCLSSLSLVVLLASCGAPTDSNSNVESPSASQAESNVDSQESASDVTSESDSVSESQSDSESESSSAEEISLKDKYNCISYEEAAQLAGTDKDVVTSEKYYIYGVIVSIENATYGNMTISDGTNTFSVYGLYGSDGTTKYGDLTEKPVPGDEIVAYGALGYFKSAELKNATLIEYKHSTPAVDESYKAASVLEARNAAVDAHLQLTGVVAKITYANGMKANGFYLVDNSGAIYVYDSNVAIQVSEGNTITVAGSKQNFIMETEAANAAKYGYVGSCQLSNATLISNDNGNTAFDTSWISSTSIKDIIDTNVSENIFTNIYKVDALITKKECSGFINYYFDDIDGVTGSYAYTQCDGSDYTWLDKYDGKICSMYLSPINVKSTASGCLYRFVPISVVSDQYTFDMNYATEYAVKYHALYLFDKEYSSDPSLEVVTTVSNELLNLSDVAISYSSSNEDAIYFETVDGVTSMHAKNAGKATVSINATLDGYTSYTGTVEITVIKEEVIDSIGVAEAIAASVDELVSVKGIVGPSLVNQVGFYLIDEEGCIAIKTDSETMTKLSIGDEVIVKGTRTQFNSTDTLPGQACILDSVLLSNHYGNHEYSTDSFITGKTLKDLYDLDYSVDYSTSVYVVEAKITFTESAYSSTCTLVAGENDSEKFNLYCSSNNQYNWLKEYEGQTVQMEVAAVNWNKKTYYRGCVLSITVDGVKIYNELNFNK